MTPIQYILLAFFVYALSRVWSKVPRRSMTLSQALVWSIFWVGAGAVVVKPTITSRVAELVGVGRGADVVVYAALAGVSYVAFRLVVAMEKMKQEITHLTRVVAIKEAQESEKK